MIYCANWLFELRRFCSKTSRLKYLYLIGDHLFTIWKMFTVQFMISVWHLNEHDENTLLHKIDDIELSVCLKWNRHTCLLWVWGWRRRHLPMWKVRYIPSTSSKSQCYMNARNGAYMLDKIHPSISLSIHFKWNLSFNVQ